MKNKLIRSLTTRECVEFAFWLEDIKHITYIISEEELLDYINEFIETVLNSKRYEE